MTQDRAKAPQLFLELSRHFLESSVTENFLSYFDLALPRVVKKVTIVVAGETSDDTVSELSRFMDHVKHGGWGGWACGCAGGGGGGDGGGRRRGQLVVWRGEVGSGGEGSGGDGSGRVGRAGVGGGEGKDTGGGVPPLFLV